MTSYRRLRVPGGTYFFIVNLLDRKSNLLVQQIDILRDSVRKVRTSSPFHIDAWVVLPNHLHCIWTLPPGDTNFSARWQAIKTAFSKRLPPTEPLSPSRQHKTERGIWQRRFWEHAIRDDNDYARHVDYIHFNPVKHNLVPHPAAWPYSTIKKCVSLGLYAPDWASQDQTTPPTNTGERP